MIKSALGKVMWVGRATVFLVGLAVILALVVGVASTAFGANGANFLLGNGINDTAKNIATLTTRLTMNGTASAPGLQVTQQSTGTGASGVGVTVPSGKAPIKVNSTAGKATNLNADKLDGKDSSAFVPTDTYVSTTTEPAPTTSGVTAISVSANCTHNLNDIVITGGVELKDGPFTTDTIYESRPNADPAFAEGWTASWRSNSAQNVHGGSVYALCAPMP